LISFEGTGFIQQYKRQPSNVVDSQEKEALLKPECTTEDAAIRVSFSFVS
jgi:hypothetical protein